MHDKNVGLAHRAARARGMPSGSHIGTGPDHWCCRAGHADISAHAPFRPPRLRPFVLPCRAPMAPPGPGSPAPLAPPLRAAVAVSPSVVMPPPPITTDAHSHHRPATPTVRFIHSTYTVPDWFPVPTLRFGLENLSGSINVR
ncbi:hypothetical protein SBRY_30600 [Actinacidiphila bryophytorum]|uniref:Uncharacterized protein n=1 Tax=Actinacidiphila bryophytorum TaxID=1436133 RepID=A0A9W4H1F1_9ACTN|nr:hypothetical protein SBRY_30600 [Actinacidiphila bryophytorum]